jgi:hypothetical protein
MVQSAPHTKLDCRMHWGLTRGGGRLRAYLELTGNWPISTGLFRWLKHMQDIAIQVSPSYTIGTIQSGKSSALCDTNCANYSLLGPRQDDLLESLHLSVHRLRL